MTRPGKGLLCALLLIPTTAMAQRGGGFVDFMYVPQTKVEITFSDPSGTFAVDGDGDGFGIRGLIPAGESVAFTGEFQTVTYEGDTDTDRLRFGIGMVGPTTSGVFLEYDSVSFDDYDMDGFAVHGRLASNPSPGTQIYGDIGYAQLTDDDDLDYDGLEFSVGAAFGVSDAFSLLADYRVTRLKASESGGSLEFEYTDLRLGGRMTFGG
jgi:hypothetical protein